MVFVQLSDRVDQVGRSVRNQGLQEGRPDDLIEDALDGQAEIAAEGRDQLLALEVPSWAPIILAFALLLS